MTRSRHSAKRTVGPLELTFPRFAILVILGMVLFGSWWVNRDIGAFYCDDETIGQGRPCLWLDDYVPWHTAITLATLLVIVISFFSRLSIYFVIAVLVVFLGSSAIMLWLWISRYYEDLDLAFIWDLVAVTLSEGVWANSILTAGLLGYLLLLIVDGRRKG
jgi:hypothetical protein